MTARREREAIPLLCRLLSGSHWRSRPNITDLAIVFRNRCHRTESLYDNVIHSGKGFLMCHTFFYSTSEMHFLFSLLAFSWFHFVISWLYFDCTLRYLYVHRTYRIRFILFLSLRVEQTDIRSSFNITHVEPKFPINNATLMKSSQVDSRVTRRTPLFFLQKWRSCFSCWEQSRWQYWHCLKQTRYPRPMMYRILWPIKFVREFLHSWRNYVPKYASSWRLRLRLRILRPQEYGINYRTNWANCVNR